MLSNRLIVGLDYGTTYTGVAFCETSDTGVVGKDILVVKDWPSRHTKIGTKEKVPSEIGLIDRTQWGCLIAPNVQRHMWTKLLLDDPKAGEAGKIMKELSLNNTQGPSKEPVDIIAEYLAHVKAHLLKNLDIHYGKGLWRTLPITLMVTVPAVWSDAAKDSTLQAVNKAGFNSIELTQLKRTVLTSEPEAAAIYTTQSLQGGIQDEQFAVGDGFIVCDMGGGTVDLISYRVAELEPTTLEEATTGSGDQCGGSFVERGFLKWLERRLGTADFVLIAGERSEGLPRTSLSSKLSRMVQDFVLEAKSGFSGNETNFLRLPVPFSSVEDDEARGIQDGEIMITPADMKEMFEFPLRRTYELLLQQMQQARRTGKVQIKYVFMVGGFAESPYIYEKIKAFAEANGLIAIRPAHAWSAIVRGAAAKGLEGDGRASIKNRKCRRYYGTDCYIPFVPGQHREVDSFICPYTGTKEASNQMRWLLKKGQDLAAKTDSHANVNFQQLFWTGERRTASVKLLATDAEKAPYRSKGNGVYKVATLDVDLSGVPQSAFQTCASLYGRVYYTLNFSVEMAIQSSLEFSLLVKGVRYGSVTANYA
ncbi:actin-like ATPase domain-containing protein [Clathrospora elynae]|uniref:Actin-like ATPase domain-containing protein n=1 Tax=Clathrospora elynae TaxID=706981 RepID=A0A6A5SVT9_9PLEO|nr:actin-like ATPase domain-containing protein [Clathrospora elynae]